MQDFRGENGGNSLSLDKLITGRKKGTRRKRGAVYFEQMRRLLLILLFFFALAFIVYPSAFLSPKNTLPDDNDTRLIAYIITQVQNNLLHHQPLFWGTYFAPYQNTLTYSEPFATSAMLTLPLRLFTSSPILIFNLAFVINFVLTLTASFLLFRYLFDDDWLAIFTTVLLNLTGFHLSYLPHLQVFSLWPILLSIYLFLRFQSENRIIFIYLFLLTLTFQITESLFGAYLIFIACFIIFLEKRRHLKAIFFRTLFFLPLWLIFLFPYLKLHLTFPEAVRPIRDAAHFSLGLEEVFTKYQSWVLIALLVLSHGRSLIESFVAIFCKVRKAWSPAKTGVYAPQTRNFPRRGKLSVANKWTQSKNSSWHIILFFSLIMSLGPVLKVFGQNLRVFGLLIPLPYALFYYIFPGFNGFRTPSRFIILAAIAAVIIIGYKLQPIFRKLLPQTKFFLITLLTLILMLEFRLPYPSYPVNITPPPIYQMIRDLPDSDIILELPIKLWNDDGHEIESLRSLYSLDHGHRRVGGYSGFAPLTWIDLVENLKASGLSPENRNRLHALGITIIVENGRGYFLL